MNVNLTRAEITAALEAISQMTDGNARDFEEWKLSTSGTWAEWQALCRVQRKLHDAVESRSVDTDKFCPHGHTPRTCSDCSY